MLACTLLSIAVQMSLLRVSGSKRGKAQFCDGAREWIVIRGCCQLIGSFEHTSEPLGNELDEKGLYRDPVGYCSATLLYLLV